MERKNPNNKKAELLQIAKYLFSAGSSFVIDLVLFTIFKAIFEQTGIISDQTPAIITATIIARVLSSLYNYFMNSRVVFKEKGAKRFIGYVVLVVVQMGVSAGLVSLFSKLIPINSTIIKAVIDIIIFVVNYLVQKFFIFSQKEDSWYN